MGTKPAPQSRHPATKIRAHRGQRTGRARTLHSHAGDGERAPNIAPMHMFSTPASIYASMRFQRAAKAEQALDQARAIRRPEWALRTRNLAAPSVGAHENARIDAHAPGADNAGGNIMLMRMEMIWRIHMSAYAAHMHAMAATRWLASHTRRLGGSHHLGLVDGRAHRTLHGMHGNGWAGKRGAHGQGT